MVLVSGGLDSAVTLAVAARDGHACIALSFDYGQRHRIELSCAAAVAARASVLDHRVVQIDAAALAGSALTGCGDVPRGRSEADIGTGIPDTYVPARNLVMLAHATAIAETAGAHHVYIGANAVDYSGYPDCRGVFLDAFEQAANLATRAGVEGAPLKVCAPLLDLPKADIITLGLELGVDFSLTNSCYDPDPQGRACGACDSCTIRSAGFKAAGVEDPRR